MKTQKDAAFEVIVGLRGEGKTDVEVVTLGSAMLLDSHRAGDWTIMSGPSDSESVLKYAVALLKNWMKRDTRLNGGEAYVPKVRRGPRVKTVETFLEDMAA